MPIRPLLLGHRGARGEKSLPENTFASFDRALARGCDGFEFDVRLSADGRPVICHDASIRRLRVAETPAEQLALPSLREVLQRYRHKAFLDIELKVRGLEDIVLDLLQSHPPARGYVVSSFLPEVLEVIHGMDSSIPLGLICETRAQLKLCREFPVEYVILHHQLASKAAIAEIKDAGKKLLVWTVNTLRDIHRFAHWGVDGLISDYPDRMVLVNGGQLSRRVQK